jgi:hypothetical protein
VKKNWIYVASLLVVGLAGEATAQIQVGNNLMMNLNGSLTFGYSAAYGDLTASTHTLGAGGNGDLTGSYYNPKFFSFSIAPYYNQNRNNSASQSISDATGLNATASIFSGSSFPGFVSYAKAYNSSGTFGVPGLVDFTTHGNSDVFSVGWSEILPDKPHVSFTYQQGKSDYSLYGTESDSSSSHRSFSTQASDEIKGFQLNGSFHHDSNHSLFPQIFTDQAPAQSDSTGTGYSFGLGHKLPLNGSFSANASRSDTNFNFAGGTYDATIDSVTGNLSINPTHSLTMGMSSNYTDNLAGTLYQPILVAGGGVPASVSQSSHALDVSGFGTYAVGSTGLSLNGTVGHREQSFLGTSLTANTYTATASYGIELLGGFFNSVAGLIRTTLDPSQQTTLGYITSANYSRQVGAWSLNGAFNYSRNTQTFLVSFLNSGYGYSGSASRRLGALRWNGTFSINKSTVSGLSDSDSSSQNYSTAVSLKRFAVSGSYSRSTGNAILTSTGLTPTPVPTPGLGLDQILYGGHAWSAGIGATPIRGLTLAASYASSRNNTFASSVASTDKFDTLNATAQYQFRKMYFRGGFTRFVQGFSVAGTPPAMVGSYYIGVYRWFDFF